VKLIEVAQLCTSIGTFFAVGAAWGMLFFQVKRVARDIAQMLLHHAHLEGRVDKLEQDFADLRGRVMERLRLEVTPPHGTRR